MKECMLHNPQLLKILTKLMSTVIIQATYELASIEQFVIFERAMSVTSVTPVQCIIFANHTERFTKTLTLDLEQVWNRAPHNNLCILSQRSGAALNSALS